MMLQPKKSPRLQTTDYNAAIRLLFTLRATNANFIYDSRMSLDATTWKVGAPKVEQTISGRAESAAVRKYHAADNDHGIEAERFFSGKKMFVHITERPKTETDARWPYVIILHAIQDVYHPTFQWRIDDRSLFTRISTALLQEAKITFEVRLRDDDSFFRDLRLLESRKGMALLPLHGVRFWLR
jgi:hypothetical protein